MEKAKINSLILDYTIYPRVRVDDQHVHYMVESLKAGIELPPVIADKTSKRVVDGFHRITAGLRYSKLIKSKNPEIDVIFKKYDSDSEIFIDAMRYNSTHGRTLTQYDRAHCILRAEELGLSIDVISEALSISIDKYGELKACRIGELHISPHTKNAKYKGDLIPLKRTIGHKSGKRLTKKQFEVNKKLSGMNQAFYVNQIIDLIESDLLDKENENLMERLSRLYELLKEIHLKTA